MGADIHASIEYAYKHSIDKDTGEPTLIMTFADLNLPRAYTMFGLLGYQGRDLDAPVVPLRGWPRTPDGQFYGDIGWGFRAEACGLVVRSARNGVDGFSDDFGQKNEGDGTCLTPDGAERWLTYGSIYLPRDADDMDPSKEYVYISNPDIHSVNWITADEMTVAVEALVAQYEGEGYVARTGSVIRYIAVRDLMRALESDPEVGMVRLIYGFDN